MYIHKPQVKHTFHTLKMRRKIFNIKNTNQQLKHQPKV